MGAAVRPIAIRQERIGTGGSVADKREATRVARAVKVGEKEHRLEVVFESDSGVGSWNGQGRYSVDGVRVQPDDFDRVLRLAALA
jgi:hypothetical protein